MCFLDLHIHTIYSDGISTPREIIEEAFKRGIKVIAITDHDTLKGVRKALEYSSRYDIVVVPGLEIDVKYCHVLALCIDMNSDIGSLKKSLRYCKTIDCVYRVIEWIHAHNGIAVLAHPYGKALFLPYPILRYRDIVTLFDGIEAINGRVFPSSNLKALRLAEILGMPYTVGSDAHRACEVGFVKALCRDCCSSIEDVIKCIRHHKLAIVNNSSRIGVLRNVLAKRIQRLFLRSKVF